MSKETEVQSAIESVELPPDLGIESIADLSELLAPRLRSEAAVIIDAHAVARVHSAALQLLCMFCNGRRKAGRDTQWLEPSETLRQAATMLSLTPLLQLVEAV